MNVPVETSSLSDSPCGLRSVINPIEYEIIVL